MRYVSANAADVISDNIQMSINLYRAVNELNPAIKIIQPLANCGYPGDSSIQHEENWLDGDVHESVFSFGNSKRCMYYLSKCYNDQYGINTVNLLFPNTYGPGDSVDPSHTHAINGMIIRMLEAKRSGKKEFVVWGSGKPIREWAYIDDFIEALVRGLNLDNIIHPINVGQQKGYSISESAKLIKEEMGFDGEIVFNTNYQDGAPIKIMSRQKFDALFASFEWFDHRKGIANTIRYYEGVL
jgi:GDP-L-fucose synthase